MSVSTALTPAPGTTAFHWPENRAAVVLPSTTGPLAATDSVELGSYAVAGATPHDLVARLLRDGVAAAAPIQTGGSMGLVPWCASAVAARPVESLFSKFMREQHFAVDVASPQGPRRLDVNGLLAPGHNSTLVAALALLPNGLPQVILKGGDTRMPRHLRGEPYVMIGFIAGRWDHKDMSGPMVGIAEIGEEVGGKALEGGYWGLGNKMAPTMPYESTEADMYRAAVIRLDGEAHGDGGGMELVGLMGPKPLECHEALRAMDGGLVADGGRVRVMYGRAFDSIGFVPQLGVYVQDHAELQRRFDSLGMGAPRDIRSLHVEVPASANQKSPLPNGEGVGGGGHTEGTAELERVNAGVVVSRHDVPLGQGATLVDAQTAHAACHDGETKIVGKTFPNQMLLLDYDRAKIGVYYVDPRQGPMVALTATARPLMAAKELALDAERTCRDENTNLVVLDVPEMRIDRGGAADAQVQSALQQAGVEGRAVPLGDKVGASTGQSDLYYRYYAVEVPPSPQDGSFVPLSDAIAACRQGEGDAQTEALLQRLASHTKWIPSLRMTETDARSAIGG